MRTFSLGCHIANWSQIPRATVVEQLAHGWLRLGFELCAPVAESLERYPLRFTILSLIQVAAIPRLMVRPSKLLS
jgi:hypothetical protein